MKKKYELLAPVGSAEALIAAVQGGADAIYMGGKNFSARQYANNFESQDIINAIDYAHLRGVKVYITLNTLIKEKEMKEALEYVNFLYGAGADALIIQDIGLAYAVKRLFPDFEIHGSTQMTINSLQGIKALEDAGFSRVVVAREMSLKDIANIAGNTKMEIEVFVHGALCISYSGQCLMSSLIGGRSGNRGRCAQPCRKPYSLMASSEDVSSKYLLSPKDLCTIDDIDKLLNSGVVSFKIEGRMKRPEYVATVVSTYRKAIDNYIDYGKAMITEDDKKKLAQVFNRDFTKGYLLGEKGQNLMSLDKPNNRGIYLGKVINYNKAKGIVDIHIQENLSIGDGIEVWKKDIENIGVRVEWIRIGNNSVEKGYPGSILSIPIKGDVAKGDIVYKTNDVELNKSLAKYYSGENIRKQSVDCELEIITNQRPKLMLSAEDGHQVDVMGEDIVRQAQNKPLTKEIVINQLNKLGDTPFEIRNMKIDLDNNAFMSMSQLNNLRREAVDKLKDKITIKYRRDENNSKAILKDYRDCIKDENNSRRLTRPKLAIHTSRLEVLQKALKLGVTRVYFSELRTMDRAINIVQDYESELFISLPQVSNTKESELIIDVYDKYLDNISGLLLSNLGQMQIFEKQRVNKVANFSINAFNKGSLAYLSGKGISMITLPLELTLSEIRDVISDSSMAVELIVYGRIPMMIMDYCPVSPNKNPKNCNDCEEACYRERTLEDSTGAKFPIMKDSLNRTIIYNSQPLYICDKIEDVARIGVEYLRINITNESDGEVEAIIKGYQDSIKCFSDKQDCPTHSMEELDLIIKTMGFTRGHYYRGVD